MLNRWKQPNGYRDVLDIGMPMIVSMGSMTVMQFTDQVFLARYSLNAVAAAMPAGIASFVFVSFFLGVAGYVNVFVAQYSGSGAEKRVGASIWQGLYFCILASVCLVSISFIGRPLFELSGHPSEILDYEATYFGIMTAGAGLRVISMVLACFFSGLGLTRPIMVVSLIAAAINIPLDYAMINGLGPFPEMGIAGAAWATITASALNVLMLVVLIFNRENDCRFGVWSGRRFDGGLFKRFMRFGLPGGVQFFIDIFAFSCFVIFLGRLGTAQLAAANIAIAINHLAFMPVIGLSVAVSTLVGQAIGKQNPDEAVIATNSAVHIGLVYMVAIAIIFLVFPMWLSNLFKPVGMPEAEFASIASACVVLLRFVAAYTIIDALVIVYSAAIKGAGDTKFVMWTMGVMSITLLVVPVYVEVEYLGLGLNAAFATVLVYVVALAVVNGLRFRQGKWKKMRVIEPVL